MELLSNKLNCPSCAGYILQTRILEPNVKCSQCGKYGVSYKGKRKIDMTIEKRYVNRVECSKCLAIMDTEILNTHKKYYCNGSKTCVKVTCEICKDVVNLTTFQTHYERHLFRKL